VSGSSVVPVERIEQRVLLLRGQKVMLGSDLAQLYGIEPKALMQAVKRNADRFPSDFMFQLTPEEARRSKFRMATQKHGPDAKSLPYAFTEPGVVMLSGVLRGKRAARVSVEIIRTFVRMRQLLESHPDFAEKLEELEEKSDPQFRIVFDAIRHLVSPPSVTPREPLGFGARERRAAYGKPLPSATLNSASRRRQV